MEYFFILSGFFTIAHFEKSPVNENTGMEAVRYTLRKFQAYLPYVAAAILLRYGLDAIPLLIRGDIKGAVYSFLNIPFEISLLTSSGLAFEAKLATIWYLSALFIVMPLFTWLLLKSKDSWPVWALLLPILYYGKFGENVTRTPLNDMLRAFVGMTLGTLVYFAVRKTRTVQVNRCVRTGLTLLEISMFLISIYITFGNKSFSNLLLFTFPVSAGLALSNKTWSASIKGKWCAFLGKISLPIYLFHIDIALILQGFSISTRSKLVLYYVATVLFAAVAVLFVEICKKHLSLKAERKAISC